MNHPKRSLLCRLISPHLTRRGCLSLAASLCGTDDGKAYLRFLTDSYLPFLDAYPQYSRCCMCTKSPHYLNRGVCPCCGHRYRSRRVVTVGQKRKSLHASRTLNRQRGYYFWAGEETKELHRLRHHDDNAPYEPDAKRLK